MPLSALTLKTAPIRINCAWGNAILYAIKITAYSQKQSNQILILFNVLSG